MQVLDKTIWLTGASSGMGEQMAYQLCEKGAKLILSSRREDALLAVKEKCVGKWKDDILVLPMDLSQPDSFNEKAQQVFKRFGEVDILINNGGISQRALVEDTSMEVYRKVMEVDFFAAVQLSKLVLPGMLKKRRGQHVVITSATGIISTPYRSAYAAAKHALHGFYDALHAEGYHRGIRVTLVCPGFVQTNVSYNALTGTGESRKKHDKEILKGLKPEKAAAKIVRALEKEKEEIYFGGGTEMMGIYIKRFFPGLFARLVRKYAPK